MVWCWTFEKAESEIALAVDTSLRLGASDYYLTCRKLPLVSCEQRTLLTDTVLCNVRVKKTVKIEVQRQEKGVKI